MPPFSPSIREELNFIHNRYFSFLFLIRFKNLYLCQQWQKGIPLFLSKSNIFLKLFKNFYTDIYLLSMTIHWFIIASNCEYGAFILCA
jgi:hypothetical protein